MNPNVIEPNDWPWHSSRLFTSAEEQETDEDTPDDDDENAQLLDEMSRALENLLEQSSEMISTTSTVIVSICSKEFLVIVHRLFA